MRAFRRCSSGRDQHAEIWLKRVLEDAWTPRNVEFIDPKTQQAELRGLGVVVACEKGRLWRGLAETCSPRAIGHMGLGGQVAWADPETGLSFCYSTNGAQRNPVVQGTTSFQLSMLAVACLK